MTVDKFGNIYFVDYGNARIRKISPDGTISTFAGNGTIGGTGNGGLATAATIAGGDLASDSDGNIYMGWEATVRKITASTGIISAYAGTGVGGFSGDGGAATAAKLGFVASLDIDSADNLYIADQSNNRIRMVTASTGVITTFAGTGVDGRSGDGGAATAANISLYLVRVDAADNVYICSQGSTIFRKISTGIITHVGGTGAVATEKEGSPVLTSALSWVTSFDISAEGKIVYATSDTGPLRRFSPGGTIQYATGNAFNVSGFAQGSAQEIKFSAVSQVRRVSDGLLVVDSGNFIIRKIHDNGATSIVAGEPGLTSTAAPSGLAIATRLGSVLGMTTDRNDNIYFSQIASCGIFKIAPDATISRIAGTGACAVSADESIAASSPIQSVYGLAVAANGEVYFTEGYTIRRIKSDGKLVTVAGLASAGASGDGGPAAEALLNFPFSIEFDSKENLYIGEILGPKIRKIEKETGTISSYVGTGVLGFSGMNGPATAAKIGAPAALSFDKDDNLYFPSNEHGAILRVLKNGTIEQLSREAPTPCYYMGDGETALQATSCQIHGISLDAKGNIYFSVPSKKRIRVLKNAW